MGLVTGSGEAGRASSVAIARLATEDALPASPEPVTKPIGGPLARLSGMWCAQAMFTDWLAKALPAQWARAAEQNPGLDASKLAAICIRAVCNVTSRSELDHDPVASRTFLTQIRLPYMEHMERQQERTAFDDPF